MLELERLGVRVVSGRLGRGKDDEEGDEGSDEGDKKSVPDKMGGVNTNMGGVSIEKLSIPFLATNRFRSRPLFSRIALMLDGWK